MTVTFFGHSNSPQSVEADLKRTIIELIERQGADVFYVGTHGNFDHYANSILKKLSKQYIHIKYYTILAYMPGQAELSPNYGETILPEAVAESHPKYAISKRNDWMLNKSDTVVVYIKHTHGGAAKYYQKSISQGKTIINLAETKNS